MDNDKLNNALEKLDKALREADLTDRQSVLRLNELMTDVRQRLENANSEHAENEDSLSERIKQAVFKFEVKHPRIAEALDEIKLALYGLGL